MRGRLRRAWRELCRSDADAEQAASAVDTIAGPVTFEDEIQEIRDLHEMQRRPDLSPVRDLVDEEIRRAELSMLEWMFDNS